LNGYNFTDAVRSALQAAREEAAALYHEYVGTEHILLGLLQIQETSASIVLAGLRASPPDLRRLVLALVRTGHQHQTIGPDLPYTSRAKKVLELSMMEARGLDNSYVGTEHLLLGLLGEEKGLAAQALSQAGLSTDQVRAEVRRVIRTPEQPPHPRMAAGPSLAPLPGRLSGAPVQDLAKRALLLAVIALVVAITALFLSLR
jgi:ATP-dependent Clp protease ATP-binding subunit ClpC